MKNKPLTDLANSITEICMPKQIPRQGILFSLAYFAVNIIPLTPRSPNPPGTKTHSAFCNEILPLFQIYSKTITQIKLYWGDSLSQKRIIKREKKTSKARKSECLCMRKACYKSDQQNPIWHHFGNLMQRIIWLA